MKSARQQKAQTLKILLLIHNDAAVLDIFKFTLHFHFNLYLTISLTLQTVTICASKLFTHFHHCFFFFFLSLAFDCSDEQNVLEHDMNHGVIKRNLKGKAGLNVFIGLLL